MKSLYWILIALLMVACDHVPQEQMKHVDSLNRQAYNIRYTDIDSTYNLAMRAFEESGDYTDGKAHALTILAYVDYQQMDFASAFHKLDTIGQITGNQIILLVGDVLRMKINQRIGDGLAYFDARYSAQKRMKRAEEEYDQLSETDRHRLFFARTEYHIISSTYCYYQDQTREAIDEMEAITDDFTTVSDSTQWLYYHYMMGSGGLIEGTPEEIATQEFDHLMICWGFSHNMGVTYFEANSLQALASLLSNPDNRTYIQDKNSDLYRLLVTQHQEWMPHDTVDVQSHLPEALALHAVYSFRRYKDLFQTACAYRTLGEMAFDRGSYEEALDNYSMALDCVNEQYLYNNNYEDSPLLSLYDDGNNGIADIELSWIASDSIYTVPEWIAGIRQKISMAFSALGMKRESDYNRSIYLDIIARTSQNVEMESRRDQLQHEADALRLRLTVTALLFVLLVSLITYFAYRLRKSNESRIKRYQMEKDTNATSSLDADHLQVIEDEKEELEEQTNLYALKIDANKRRNAEKRAKVSMVHAVTPFLDRIINQTDRMNRDGKMDQDKLQYIIELTDRIVTYNDILTDWIKMEKGELAMQIGTTHLDKIFQTLQRGHYAYDQKGVTLDVQPTELLVKADEALTLFMLNTLADNARKFTPEGGKVTVKAEGYDDYVELSVTDTGCGMSEEDVDTLNNSKVYDSRKIGQSKEGKGFGFGIMNCRGIIEKYRKTSAIFQVCCFGVESRLGEGSRFYFRLPRVITMLLLLLCGTFSFAQQANDIPTSTARECYEQAYSFNQKGQYVDAIDVAMQGLWTLCPELTLSREDEMYYEDAVNEVDLFLRGDSLSYDLAISLRNEIACSALALNEWDIYRYNNTLSTSLYKLCHQDQSLPTYCEKLQQTQSTSRQLLVLLVLFSILFVALSFILLRHRLNLGKGLMLQRQLCQQLEVIDRDVIPSDLSVTQRTAQHLLHATFEGMNSWQHVEGLKLQLLRHDETELMSVEEGMLEGEEKTITMPSVGTLTMFGVKGEDENLNRLVLQTLSRLLSARVVSIAEALEEKERQSDELNHLRYEENRLHIQNQILDNCLSTIKHESMYYPSRIQHLAQRILDEQDNDLEQLTELGHYYKEVYTLLSTQADKLTTQTYYRKEKLSVLPILEKAQRHFNKLARKSKLECQLSLEGTDKIQTSGPSALTVSADMVLVEELMERFNMFIIKRYNELSETNTLTETHNPSLRVQRDGSFLKFIFCLPGFIIDDAQAHALFYPESGHINLLIAKQIVRELDALSNFPGLRLVAEASEHHTTIWFSLVSPSKS